MRSREGDKRPCTFCGVPTRFRLQLVGPRGGSLRTVDCCPRCGEDASCREPAQLPRAA